MPKSDLNRLPCEGEFGGGDIMGATDEEGLMQSDPALCGGRCPLSRL